MVLPELMSNSFRVSSFTLSWPLPLGAELVPFAQWLDGLDERMQFTSCLGAHSFGANQACV